MTDNNNKKFIAILKKLIDIPTPSGFEIKAQNSLKEAVLPYFDEFNTVCDSAVFVRRCGKKNAPRLLLDAHIDEIALMVSDITDDGFLRVSPLGGVDNRTLSAARVIIHTEGGKLPGVISAIPPHLQKKGESDKLTKVSDMTVDTGLSGNAAKKKISIGDPVTLDGGVERLLKNRICSHALDNKICAAIIVYAVSLMKPTDCDIYALFSSSEETNGLGAKTAPFVIKPDAAISLDVNFAVCPGAKDYESLKMGKGPAVSLSSVTERSITNSLIACAEDRGIPHQVIVEPSGTGTNADAIMLCRESIPTAAMSVALSGMHTQSEICDTDDAINAAALLCGWAEEGFVKWL